MMSRTSSPSVVVSSFDNRMESTARGRRCRTIRLPNADADSLVQATLSCCRDSQSAKCKQVQAAACKRKDRAKDGEGKRRTCGDPSIFQLEERSHKRTGKPAHCVQHCDKVIAIRSSHSTPSIASSSDDHQVLVARLLALAV
jgi:hypothetical protein